MFIILRLKRTTIRFLWMMSTSRWHLIASTKVLTTTRSSLIGSRLDLLRQMERHNKSISCPSIPAIWRNGRSSESRAKNLLKRFKKKQRHLLRELRQLQPRVQPRVVRLLRRSQTTGQGRCSSSRISAKKADHKSSARTLPDTLKTCRWLFLFGQWTVRLKKRPGKRPMIWIYHHCCLKARRTKSYHGSLTRCKPFSSYIWTSLCQLTCRCWIHSYAGSWTLSKSTSWHARMYLTRLSHNTSPSIQFSSL